MRRLSDAIDEVEQARRPAPQHPQGWEPGVEWDGRTGNITAPTTDKPDWDALLSAWDMDPDAVEVIEPVQMRSWDAAIGNGEVRRMYYYRAGIRRKRGSGPDIEELLGHIKRRSAGIRDPLDARGSAYLLGFADLQLGKKGTAATVDRIVAGIDASARRLKALRKKRSIGACYIPGLGDLLEACDGHYPMQAFEVELDGREQSRLGRRLLTYAIEQHRSLVERTVCPAVAGNHGEKRKDGKAYTTFGDNADIEVYENVAEAYEMAGATDVSFVIPARTLTLTLDIGGQVVGMAHGHQARRGGATPQAKVAEWWRGQIAGRRPVGDADILLTGHFHQFSIQPLGPRWHIQFPTVDSGSQWWDETAGTPTHSGMLSMVIGKDYPLGFGDLEFT